MKVLGTGPFPARVMIVGEAPGEHEEQKGIPFCGPSGHLLKELLADAGINRDNCYVTNICRWRPPGNAIDKWIWQKKTATGRPEGFVPMRAWWVHPNIAEGLGELNEEIAKVQPTVIVPMGNVALWALTQEWGITNWRGSQLSRDGVKVIPTLHPAFVLRDWSQRVKVVTDLKRVAREQFTKDYRPEKWKALVDPSFQEVLGTLHAIRGLPKLVWDIETAHGHIVCLGVAWSATESMCIPFTRGDKDAWSAEEEAQIIYLIYKVMRYHGTTSVFQNGLYDEQYFMEHWHFCPTLLHGNVRDTMVQSHVIFLRQDKDLATQASLFCEEYRFWKEDGKDWRAKGNEKLHWRYNCEDCIRTWECDEVEARTINTLGLNHIAGFQHSLRVPVLWAMRRGVLVDPQERRRLQNLMDSEREARQCTLEYILGHPLNTKSTPQMRALFYEDLGLKVIKDRSTGKATLGEKALVEIGEKNPILAPLVNTIREVQTIRTIKSNFLDSELDPDGRMRSMFQPAGPYTLRLSSSENAFGRGGNLQNIPTRGSASDRFKGLTLPDVRTLFIPDRGMDFWNLDLDRADLQVMVWEAADAGLKSALRAGVDMHLLAVRDVYGIDLPDDEILESSPKCREHKARYALERYKCKKGIHSTNYVVSAWRLAAELGITVKAAEAFQKRWFEAHPGLWEYRERVQRTIKEEGCVRNKFGYVWRVQERIDSILPDALAWIPQSTVACAINRIWQRLWDYYKEIEVLLQVHDSLAGQFPSDLRELAVCWIQDCAKAIVIPYEDPLVIPATLKVGPSWGGCK